jgi:PAS domain S-box-containing protein
MHRFSYEFLDSVPIGICAFDAHGRLTSANSEAVALIGRAIEPGITEEQMLVGFRLFNPAGMMIAPSAYPITRAVRDKVDIENEEVVLEAPNGSRAIFMLSVRAIRDHERALKGVIATVRDITAWRHSENAYRESEARYERAARAGKVGVWEYDVRTNMLYISPLLRELLGYTEEELPNDMTAWCHLVHPDDVEPMIANTNARLAGDDRDYTIECRRLHKDGTYRDFRVQGSIIRDASGAPLRITGSDTDITEQKRTDEELHYQYRLTDTIAKGAGEALYMLDAEGRVTFMNDAAERMFGWSIEESRGVVLHDLVHYIHPDGTPFPMAECPLGRVLHSGSSMQNHEDVFIHRDGSHINVFCSNAPVYQDGRISGAVLAVTDITGLKRTQEALRQREEELREAARRKDEFLAMLAHELRNPLAAISNAAQLLTMPEMEDLSDWSRDVIERQVGQLTRLIDDLLDVSRITRGKIELRLETLDPSIVVRRAVDAVQPQMNEHRHTLTLEVESHLPMVDADPTRLEQVIVNLLTNAAKYTPEGGRVDVMVNRDGDDVLFTVRDNGMGIAAEVLPKVFDLFAQDKRSLDRSLGGLGIGLTIVDRIVAMHGGSVSAESDGPGNGSAFMVRLPASARRRSDVSQPTPPLEMRPRQILIVDDNLDNAAGMALLLRRAGHTVNTSHEGTSAAELVERTRPEVVLLDIGLPGLDGYEVARRIRTADGPQPTLIAVSGYAQEEDRRRSRDAGFDHHLAKPVNMQELLALIARAQGDAERPVHSASPATI